MRALCLFLLLLLPFIGSVGGTLQVFGGGGAVTGRLWQVWSADYSFTSSSLAISYSPQPATTALQQFAAASLDFAAVDDALTSDVLQAYAGSGQLVQLPVIGNALAVTYNLPNASTTLVLNGTVLADIYLGRITTWDDEALMELNPSLGLPHVNITTAYGTNGTFDDTSAFARALGSFSSVFAAAFAGMDALPPAQDGRSVALPDGLARLSHVAGTPYSLAYVPLASLLSNQTTAALPRALMWNRSGRLLNASTAGVQSAMLDAQSQLEAGNLTADISNGPGEDSWPLSFVSYVPFFVNRTTVDACTPITEFVNLLQWALLNTQAGTDAATYGYAPLVPSYARRVLGSLNEFTCNGQPLLDEVAIFGVGPPYSVYTMWTMSYAEGNAVVEYSESADDSHAVADLTGGYVDFALVKSPPSLGGGDDDRVVLPVAAFPYVPAYNVPSLSLSASIAFDLPTLADIYLGLIRVWNHENVSRLNPGIDLPGAAIRVVYPNDYSSFPVETDALYQLLARVSPQFNASVSNASRTYSFVAALNTSIATNDVVRGLGDVDFTFAVWPAVYLADAPQVGAGSLYRGSAGAPLLHPYDLTPLLSALLDFGSALVSSSPNTSALYTLVLGPDESGWPLVGLGGMVLHTRTNEFCASAQALADFLWWTQTSEQAYNAALINNAVAAGVVPQVRRAILRVLANATCQGKPTSSLYRCISGGMLCSNRGSCSSTAGCQCNNGYSGTYCQEQSSGGDSTDTGLILAVVWTSIGGCVIVFVLALVVVAVVAHKVHKMQQAQAGQGLIMAALNEEPTPDIALDSIRIQGIDQVEAHRWNG